MTEPVRFALNELNLQQEWSMFGPDPESTSRELEVRCRASEQKWSSWYSLSRVWQRDKNNGIPFFGTKRAWYLLDSSKALYDLFVAQLNKTCGSNPDKPGCRVEALKRAQDSAAFRFCANLGRVYCEQRGPGLQAQIRVVSRLPRPYSKRATPLDERSYRILSFPPL